MEEQAIIQLVTSGVLVVFMPLFVFLIKKSIKDSAERTNETRDSLDKHIDLEQKRWDQNQKWRNEQTQLNGKFYTSLEKLTGKTERNSERIKMNTERIDDIKNGA